MRELRLGRISWMSLLIAFGFFAAIVSMTGCKKSDSNPVTTTASDDDADAADAISDATFSLDGTQISADLDTGNH